METEKNGALLPFVVALLSALLCFCSPLPAYADEIEDESPAYEVWTGYKDTSITEYNLYHKVVEDLAYRWFMASDAKRAKVPLQSTALGSYKQLSQYADDYETPEEQWKAFYSDFHPSYIVRMYSLVTYEDSLTTWSVSDSFAYQHYKEWYEWFDISQSGGGGIVEQDEYTLIPVEPWGQLDPNYASEALANLRYIAIFKTDYDTLLDYAQANDYIISAAIDTREGYIRVLTQPVGAVSWLENNNGIPYNIQWTQSWTSYLSSAHYTVVSEDYSINETGTIAYINNRNLQVVNLNPGQDGLYPILYRNVDVTGVIEGGGGTDVVQPVYPEPDTPDLPTPSNPIYVDNDNTTTTVDLTPILDALRAINTNIVSGFTAIEEDLASFAEYLGQWQETIWSELRSVNAWLERIFYKTGGGSSDGPDIIVDGDGWWSWLGTIASMLLGDLAGAVAGLGGAFDALHGLFPFSIPWDVAALLALFVSDPVTPVFDVPLPYGFAAGQAQTATVHVDLTAWDGVMSAVRSVELAIFALGLALKTRDMLRNTEVEQ